MLLLVSLCPGLPVLSDGSLFLTFYALLAL